MSEAVALHRGGRLLDAARAYGAVLALDPDHADALQLLGLVRHRLGEPADALALLDRAVRLDPELAAAWSNRALVLRALNRTPEAAQSLERALALRPDLTEAWLNLARARAALGEREAAIGAAREAARRSPEGARLLGALLAEAGQWAEAAEVLEPALRAGPADARAWAMVARCREEAGQPEAAIRAWRAALEAPGAGPELAALLGGLLLREGRAEDALPHLARAARELPADPRCALALADAVSLIADPSLVPEEALLDLLAREGLDHQRLERAVRGRLAPVAAPLLEETRDEEAEARAAELLAASPLFLRALGRMQLQHPAWERALQALSTLALRRAALGAPLPRALVEGLAAHAWNTEHAASTPENEALADALVGALPPDPAGWPALAWDRLAAALTALPLEALPALTLDGPGWEDRPLSDLVRQQRVEPARERALRTGVPDLCASEDPTSVAVRAMYEENPYPRLVGLHRRPPTPLGAHLRATLRRPELRFPWEGQALDVLVAGCGTGQHALTTATRTADARVLAVDLSLASLGRAARLAERHGVTNLRFARADILGLGALRERFHVIESVGVLHHLDDPAAGLAVLRQLLLPEGVMQIGLYSERGRAEVVAARELIAERGWASTPEGLREARRALLALPEDHPARPVVWSPDFYSLSGLRDLLFHVCERRFSPRSLGDLLDRLDLELLGFQHARPEHGRLYRERFTQDPAATDLGNWEKLEDEHPRLFSGMLVFWCRPRH